IGDSGVRLAEMVGKGGFCRKVIGFSVNFVPKPAPTLDLLCRYQIYRLTGNWTIKPSRLLGAIAPAIGRGGFRD
ncbi:MAG: hypothetical protein RIB93_23355, partial [Coleofasciculus sp. D1-CHI-01]|uniref:hypothetical protein n=1 Tax=Coleofasciculus sp. D1-CHI-01 TaxID=3068482 RepID=UPI0032F25A1B